MLVSKESTASSSTRPMVVAAGHRHVLIPKSGNTFPAFLVRLPIANHTAIESVNNDGAAEEVEYRWRSKLDFILLDRSMSKLANVEREGFVRGHANISAGKPVRFPKGAFAKLADTSAMNGCWVRPADKRFLSKERLRALHYIFGAKNWKGVKNEQMLGCYDVCMKKSLIQLDSFLSSAKSNWLESCPLSADVSNRESLVSVQNEAMILAWNHFCRDSDVGGLIDQTKYIFGLLPKCAAANVGERTTVAMPQTTQQKNNIERNAARWGQYFATDCNAKKTVDTSIEAIINLHSSDKTSIKWDNYVFIEPSCGDGQILCQLIKSLSSMGSSPRAIIGYDIDLSAVESCLNRLDDTEAKTCSVYCRDFLSLTKENILADVDKIVQKDAKSEVDSSSSTLELHFVFVGGPPYSSGPGEGDAIQRDLPLRFVHNCILDLGADVVSFILPLRCKNDSNMCCNTLNEKQAHYGTMHHKSGKKTFDQLQCITKEFEDSSFDFLGRTVIQPSILCCWFREVRHRYGS